MKQEKRRFTKYVSHLTSPGWRIKKFHEDGSFEWVSRKDYYGSNFRGGPAAVITNMAIYRFKEDTGEIYLDTVHPGFTIQDVLDHVSFDLDVSRCKGITEPPTYGEIEMLYKEIDPERLFI